MFAVKMTSKSLVSAFRKRKTELRRVLIRFRDKWEEGDAECELPKRLSERSLEKVVARDVEGSVAPAWLR